MKKIYFSVLMMIFAMYSCNQDEIFDPDIMATTDTETPFKFQGEEKEIMLWGSKAWVLDTGDKYIFQGDIVLDKSEIDAENAASSTRAAVVRDRLWPRGTVYYKVNGLSATQRSWLNQAIDNIENTTPIRFNNSPYSTNYIEIKSNGNAGYSHSNYIGYKGGRQEIGIANLAGVGSTIHELCHALGLFHEQCRADRDNHIIIDWNAVSDAHQFKRYIERGEQGYDYGAFDFNSIMLYSSRKGKNGNYDMVRRDNRQPFSAQRERLSSTDIQALSDKYWRNIYIKDVSSDQCITCNDNNITYTLSSMPAGATVTWTASSNMTLVSGQNTSRATFKAGTGRGYATVSARITYKGASINVSNSQVWIGTPPAPTFLTAVDDYGAISVGYTYNFELIWDNYNYFAVTGYEINGSQSSSRYASYYISGLSFKISGRIKNKCGWSPEGSHLYPTTTRRPTSGMLGPSE